MEKLNTLLCLIAVATALVLCGCVVNPQALAGKQGNFGLNLSGNLSSLLQGNSANSSQQGNGGGFSAPSTGNSTVLTLAEVAKHSSANDCWMAIDNQVLDLTYFSMHPGGSAYVPYCGTDATAAFNTKGGKGAGHSQSATGMFSQYLVGYLGQAVPSSSLASNQTLSGNRSAGRAPGLGTDREDEWENGWEEDD